ncbi:2866_t:CDS:2 [Diversispora eburnea]|uniref:2866_t:CDS:1 n=1 Tax=Diversispora eburnea TaxID=1213867 RepID=A0A9N9B1G0_9GLOM|nr:2866_t:CDS:2 [Diversispora eburnea]
MSLNDVRIIVAIDFGTTFSGFAYVHKESKEIETNCSWQGREGVFKTPTALQYDETYTKVIRWGEAALVDEYEDWEDYEWPGVKFPEQVGLVLTIPAEWPPNTTAIMRKCAFNAGLLTSQNSSQLEFTTEPEAAALYCLKIVKEHDLLPGDSFLIVDCGGGTIDLTMRKLLPDNKLSEITERVGDLCGGTFVDKEFLNFLGRNVGFRALESLKKNNYAQLQGLIRKFFCLKIKHRFNGDSKEFRVIRLNLQQFCPDLKKYVTEDVKSDLESKGWLIKINFEAVKLMFDPVINKIIKLISDHLKSTNEKCSIMFLVGGFSESKYLLRQVKEHFKDQNMQIAVPSSPITAVVRGAITYGLNIEIVNDRILKWTYGIAVVNPHVPGRDPKKRRTPDGYIQKFHLLATRGSNTEVKKKFFGKFIPLRFDQPTILFNVYYTHKKGGARYCDEPGMKFLGSLNINNPMKYNKSGAIEFSLTFGLMEIKATACDSETKKPYKEVTFKINF